MGRGKGCRGDCSLPWGLRYSGGCSSQDSEWTAGWGVRRGRRCSHQGGWHLGLQTSWLRQHDGHLAKGMMTVSGAREESELMKWLRWGKAWQAEVRALGRHEERSWHGVLIQGVGVGSEQHTGA